MTRGSLRICAGGPCAIRAPNSIDVDLVAPVEDETHVVVDEQDRSSAVDDASQPLPERVALGGVEPGGRLVHADQARRRGDRPRDPDQHALTVRQLAGLAIGEIGRADGLERVLDRRPVSRSPRPHEVEQQAAGTLAMSDCVQVLGHGEVVEQLDGLPGAGQPGTSTLVRRRAVEIVPVEHEAARRAA